MNLFNVCISKKAIDLVNRTLLDSHVSAGKVADAFEDKFSKIIKAKNPVSLNSCTSALHLALALAGVKNNDEVILPAQTFVATGLVILMQGAIPVFADINPLSGNISVDSFKNKITKRTKAVMVVHYGGYPCDMDEINHIAKKHGIAVIEDAAHALGATYKGKPVGALSRFTAFSFQAIKHLTCGDGGMLCCLERADYESAQKLRWFGIDRERDKVSVLGERVYNLKTIGYKYHMNDVSAAIGLGNILDFPQRLRMRQAIGGIYRRELVSVPGITLLENKSDRTNAYWIFTVLAKKRQNFIRKLKSKGIASSIVHSRIDKNLIFGGIDESLVNQKKFNQENISIPVHEGLKDKDVKTIISCIRKGW